MERTGEDVATYLETVTPAVRRRDAQTLVAMLREITGLEPELWTAKIIGFGEYSYEYPSGRGGTAGAAGFAPRKTALTIYLPDGVGSHADALARLGPHTTGVGCLYIKKLDEVDHGVLRGILTDSFQRLTAGTYGKRARDGGTEPAPD